MKKRKIFAAVGAATILVLAACSQPSGSGGSNPPAVKGLVNINLAISGGGSAGLQIILPGSESYSAFGSYTLSLTRFGSESPVTLDVTSLAGIELDVGEYALQFTAWTGPEENKDKAAATGAVETVTVVEAQTTDVVVPLTFETVSGEGDTLTGTVTNSSGLTLTEASLEWTPLSAGGTAKGSESLDVTDLTLNESLTAGYYLITVTLFTDDLEAIKRNIVYIAAGQTQAPDWEFLSAEDFLPPVADIWLLGVNDQWQTYTDANKLTEQTVGIFVWEGEMSQSYFRFSLDNTSSWGSDKDKDKPRRFEPASDGTGISFGAETNMTYVKANTGTPAAWDLGGAGYYQFEVNPRAKTLIVTKPVVVESVVIKKNDGGEITEISLPQGTTDYQFTAVVNGKNVAGVTWTISSGVTSGTSIGTDGKLTIAEAEPATSQFTITATSLNDASKSASVTVTVIDKNAQALSAPTNVALSSQGVASWDGVANAVSYTAQLYKAESAQGAEIAAISGTTHNFLSAMRGAGVGSYTVKVKAVGNGTDYSESPEATSAAQNVSQKTAVVNVWWFETNKARWVNVDSDSDYTVQLYKGGSAVGSAVSVTRGSTTNPGNPSETVTTHDFSSDITTEGPGVYTFGVVTKGDVYLILDAAEKKLADGDAYKYDIKLTAPTGLEWSGTSAQWDAVTNASRYSVQLYKDGSASGSAVSVSSGTSYAGFSLSAAGLYTFKVKAIGTGAAGTGAYLDSDEADSASTADDAGKLKVGGAASITLAPLEGWKGTLGISGGGSASIAKSDGSLTISVTGGGFTTFTWIVDGANQSETSSSITLSGTDYVLGNHSVTVYALDSEGTPWSPEAPIAFTVTAN
jgi:hypothetical protein